MAFSFSGLVSAVVGAVAKVATAVVNALSPVAKGGGILGGLAGAIVGVAEAVIGVTAEFANACEDGEIDDEEAEELLEDVFKLLVGAFIFPCNSGSSITENDSNENTCKKDEIEPISGSKEVDKKDVDYLYGVIEHNDNMGVKTATFYGKGEGPSITVGGRTFGIEGEFKNDGINTKAKNEEAPFEIKLAEFETGLNEIEFDNGWSIDTVKVQAGAKAGTEGIEAYAKAALVESETAKFKIHIPFTDKNFEIGATGDLGSIGGGIKFSKKKGLALGAHYGVGADLTLDIKDRE